MILLLLSEELEGRAEILLGVAGVTHHTIHLEGVGGEIWEGVGEIWKGVGDIWKGIGEVWKG